MRLSRIVLGLLAMALCGGLANGAPVVLSNVPAYDWYHGCGPTAAASIIGYYDVHGYGNLFTASGWNDVKLTANVQDQISSPEHNAKYDPKPDDPDLPVPPFTSIADWFRTSTGTLAFGSSYQHNADDALQGYARYRGYATATSRYESYGAFTWNDLVGEIDAGRPMMFLVDTSGDDVTDHFVPVLGYDDRGADGKYYGCYTTWTENETVNWYQFREMSSSYTWGVAYGTYFDLSSIPPNNPPVAVADVYSGSEDMTLTIAAAGILANDTDLENDPLNAIQVSNPTHGTVAVNSDGSFIYTPNADYFGMDSFTYKANDGMYDSNTTTVSIDVISVNDVSVTIDDVYETPQDTTLQMAAWAGVLKNDYDPDNLDHTTVNDQILTTSLVTSVAHGSLALYSTGWFKYTPATGFSGTDSFTYRAYDGVDYSELATVLINVIAPTYIPGDANDDGRVNEADAKILAESWGQSGDWSMGDFNNDGMVNALDAAILAANWGYIAAAEQSDLATAVPEPSALVILLGGLLAVVAQRGAKRRVR